MLTKIQAPCRMGYYLCHLNYPPWLHFWNTQTSNRCDPKEVCSMVPFLRSWLHPYQNEHIFPLLFYFQDWVSWWLQEIGVNSYYRLQGFSTGKRLWSGNTSTLAAWMGTVLALMSSCMFFWLAPNSISPALQDIYYVVYIFLIWWKTSMKTNILMKWQECILFIFPILFSHSLSEPNRENVTYNMVLIYVLVWNFLTHTHHIC